MTWLSLLGSAVFWIVWGTGFLMWVYLIGATIVDRMIDGHWWWELPEDMRWREREPPK